MPVPIDGIEACACTLCQTADAEDRVMVVLSIVIF